MMNQRGFTLVELMVTLAVAMVAMASIAGVFQMQFKTLNREELASEMRDNVRTAMEMMTRELLMAGYDPSGSAGAGIVDPGASSINFTMDLNGDGFLDGANEDIEYEYDANTLTVRRNSDIIAENITDLSFSYYDDGGSPTAVAGEIRSIEIEVKGRSRGPVSGYGYLETELSSDVTPRNLAF